MDPAEIRKKQKEKFGDISRLMWKISKEKGISKKEAYALAFKEIIGVDFKAKDKKVVERDSEGKAIRKPRKKMTDEEKKAKRKANDERIRKMSDEEYAKHFEDREAKIVKRKSRKKKPENDGEVKDALEEAKKE